MFFLFVNFINFGNIYNLFLVKIFLIVIVNFLIVKILLMQGFWVFVDLILNGNSFFILLNFGYFIFEQKKYIFEVLML